MMAHSTVATLVLFLVSASNANDDHDLIHAIRKGQSDRAVELLKTHPDLANATDDGGNTPLHWAARTLNAEAVAALLNAGASVKAENESGTVPLFWAIRFGPDDTESAKRRTAIVARLIEALAIAPALEEDKKRRRETPLHVAAEYRRVMLLPLLLKAGGDVNAEDPYGRTPLHAAAIGGSVEIVQWLIKNGADVKATDRLKDTPLHMAAYRLNPEVAAALMEAGADVNAQNREQRTPLHIAADHAHRARPTDTATAQRYEQIESARLALAEALLEHGADTSLKDNRGATAMQFARINRSQKLVELFSSHARRP